MDLNSTSKSEGPFFDQQLVVVNIGIQPFYDTLKDAGIEVYQVNWNIPAGGDSELLRVLDLLLE
jgi:hypothetical protein